MDVTMLFYKLFQFKNDLAAILKRYCCHGNLAYTFILTTVRLLASNRPTFFPQKNNYCSEI